MEIKQLFLVCLHCLIDIIERNLIHRPCKRNSSRTAADGNQSCVLQLPHNISDDHRVAPYAGGQKLTGNLIILLKIFRSRQNMNGNRKFCGNLHVYLPASLSCFVLHYIITAIQAGFKFIFQSVSVPRRIPSPCFSGGSRKSRSSRHAFGLPGRFTIRVFFRIPAV